MNRGMTLKVWLFAFAILNFYLSSCSAQHKTKRAYDVIALEDSVIELYAYLNELKITSSDKEKADKTILNIQKLSENTALNSVIPKDCIKEKKELLRECMNSDSSICEYVPEKYTILNDHHDLLNINYTYNAYGAPDEYFKYACFDLKTGERMTYNKIFLDSKSVLDQYNSIYVSDYKIYMNKIKEGNDGVVDEYNLYQEHLEMRIPFGPDDLNNFELVYDDMNNVTQIRFHYNGHGGANRTLFPPDYIDFDIEDIKTYLKEDFKQRLGLE